MASRKSVLTKRTIFSLVESLLIFITPGYNIRGLETSIILTVYFLELMEIASDLFPSEGTCFNMDNFADHTSKRCSRIDVSCFPAVKNEYNLDIHSYIVSVGKL